MTPVRFLAMVIAAATLPTTPTKAAGVRAEASAIIRNGVTIQTSRNGFAPPVAISAIADPQIRIVERPCQPGATSALKRCTLILFEMQ
jgi:hypothetical protein